MEFVWCRKIDDAKNESNAEISYQSGKNIKKYLHIHEEVFVGGSLSQQVLMESCGGRHLMMESFHPVERQAAARSTVKASVANMARMLSWMF